LSRAPALFAKASALFAKVKAQRNVERQQHFFRPKTQQRNYVKNDLRNTLLCNDPATEIIKSNVSHIASHTWLPQHQTSAGHMARAPKVRPIIACVATAKRCSAPNISRMKSKSTGLVIGETIHLGGRHRLRLILRMLLWINP